jgi:hypothetical protein
MKTTLMTQQHIADFIESAKNKVLIAGYGSLLSQYSRQAYSQIMGPSMPVIVNGWERNWITRSRLENQTYAGAIPNQGSHLSAQLLALQFDESFEKREQDYRFTKISARSLDILNTSSELNHALQRLIAETPVYICETLAIESSTAEFPVSLSYLETCLVGSYECLGKEGITTFFESTKGWKNTHFNDDRQNHRYPRSSPIMPDKRDHWNTLYLDTFNALTNK